MLIKVGEHLVNLDYVRSISPIPGRGPDGLPQVRFTFADGETVVGAYAMAVLDRLAGQVVPAPPDYVVVEAFAPDRGDEDRSFTYSTAPVIAFRFEGGSTDLVPITLEGEPSDSAVYAVMAPDGRCTAVDTYATLNEWKAEVEHL